jgi:hypothetical protein
MEFAPKLIDNNVKNYIFNSLKKCHEYRVEMYSYALNIGVFLFICLVFGITLYCCRKKPISQYDKDLKMKKEQEYILSKIRYLQQTKEYQKNTIPKT